MASTVAPSACGHYREKEPSWLEAHRAGCAAPVVLGATHARALDVIPIEILTANAYQADLV